MWLFFVSVVQHFSIAIIRKLYNRVLAIKSIDISRNENVAIKSNLLISEHAYMGSGSRILPQLAR